jgi:alkaline phosphatase D
VAIDRRQLSRSCFGWALIPLVPILSRLSACGRNAARFPTRLDRLAFGSCNKQDAGQQHWKTILDAKPQLFLWLGDCIYADGLPPRKRALEYARLSEANEYRALLRDMRVIGVWDDHDYASNDQGIEYPWKVDSQRVFLDFIGEPSVSARRQQLGIYTSYMIGRPPQMVQLILLDMRYFKPSGGVDREPLGAEQWTWLESEMQKEGVALKILASSLQVLTDFSGKENWSAFPQARERLLTLIRKAPAPTVLLSGDRHMAEVSSWDLGSGKVIHELTSSGLTHFSEEGNTNAQRRGSQVAATNFGVLELQWSPVTEGSIDQIRFQALSPQSGEVLLLYEFTINE